VPRTAEKNRMNHTQHLSELEEGIFSAPASTKAKTQGKFFDRSRVHSLAGTHEEDMEGYPILCASREQ
jgi:hypothetical protein